MLRVNHLSGFGRIVPAVGGGGGAMPTFVAATATLDTSAAGFTATLPSGIQENDILLCFIETSDQAVTVSGFTEAGSSPASNAGAAPTRLTVYWKRASASESGPTVSDSGNHQSAMMIAVRGCTTSGNPFDVTNSTTGGLGTSVSVPGATTTGANRFVVVAVATTQDQDDADNFDSVSNSDLANLTERFDQGVITQAGGGIAVWTGEKATAGTYGATTVTQDFSAEWCGWTGALKP